MLFATEGGAALDVVHCGASCAVTPLMAAGSKAHGEGHIAFSVTPSTPSPTPAPAAPTAAPAQLVPAQVVVLIGDWGIPAVALLFLVALLGVFGVQAMRRRGR